MHTYSPQICFTHADTRMKVRTAFEIIPQHFPLARRANPCGLPSQATARVSPGTGVPDVIQPAAAAVQLPVPEPLILSPRQATSEDGVNDSTAVQCGNAAGSGSDTMPDGSRRQYLRWTSQLQTCFLEAVSKLGGLEQATPSRIAQQMQVRL